MSVIAKQFCRAKPKGSSVYFTSEQILPFGFSGQVCDPHTFNSLDLFHDTRFVQAHLIVYYSGGQMLAALAQNYTIIKTTGPSVSHWCVHVILFRTYREKLQGKRGIELKALQPTTNTAYQHLLRTYLHVKVLVVAGNVTSRILDKYRPDYDCIVWVIVIYLTICISVT